MPSMWPLQSRVQSVCVSFLHFLGVEFDYKSEKRDIDWEAVGRQLLRALRGKRSQLALSRRLGYRGRPVADWEAGRRFPTAATLIKVCRVTGVDISTAFEQFHPPSAHALGDAQDAGVAAWLSELRSSTPIVELAKRSGHPRFRVSRWLSGHSRPRGPQFLSLVEALTGRAADLVAQLVDISQVPGLSEAHNRQLAAKRLAFEHPWSAAILRVLETVAYANLATHTPGWIAGVLGVAPEQETVSLDKLAAAGMVSIDRTTGKYICVPSTVDTHASELEMAQLKSHWAGVGADKIQHAGPDDLFSFNIISVSAEDLQHIRQLMRSTYREIRSLVAASTPVEQVALVQLQLAAWNPDSHH